MKISIVTLVNNIDLYADCVVQSFNGKDCELVPIYYPPTASIGLNEGIRLSHNDIVVCCHQDVVFPENWTSMLKNQIYKIDDDNFGVLGTYGIDIHGNKGIGNVRSGSKELYSGHPPGPAMYLDEHCLIIRKSSGLAFDEGLLYFHLYGADLCLSAYEKGMRCYAIDAKVHHLSDNLGDKPELDMALEWFTKKWRGRTRFHNYRTTCRGGIRL